MTCNWGKKADAARGLIILLSFYQAHQEELCNSNIDFKTSFYEKIDVMKSNDDWRPRFSIIFILQNSIKNIGHIISKNTFMICPIFYLKFFAELFSKSD